MKVECHGRAVCFFVSSCVALFLEEQPVDKLIQTHPGYEKIGFSIVKNLHWTHKPTFLCN